MRLIGITSDPQKAEAFVGYLDQLGKGAVVRPEAESFGVWVLDEAALPKAKADWARFETDPEHEDFRIVARPALEELGPESRVEEAPIIYLSSRPTWQPTAAILAATAVSVTVLTWFGEDRDSVFRRITFGPVAPGGVGILPFDTQEPWRAITPVFLHFSFIHLLFNLLMLRDLACQVERKVGRWGFLAMFLVFAAGSNFAEAFMGPTLLFGGLSGVMYGFFGYVLVQTLNPALNTPPNGYFLRSMTTLILLAWFALGVVQKDLPVTNWGNAGGLLLGLGLGGAVTLARQLWAKPAKI